MTVPTHNLYDFVHVVTKKQHILFYHFPFGSRDLLDVCSHQPDMKHLNGPMGISPQDRIISQYVPDNEINHHYIHKTQSILFCHDQEPLNFDLYLDDTDYVKNYCATWDKRSTLDTKNFYYKNFNLRWVLYNNIQKSWILLHSEINSSNLDRYESTGRFVGAYWWSHAIIARDWYRFAEYDTTLIPNIKPSKLFLMYCRDTTGSRCYRQELLQKLQQQSLLSFCQTKSFDGIEVTGDASAIYNATDYNQTAFSIILETVFDQRIHLTEKTLRPIACGHPFILAAGPGSLKLLRSYGFRTFTGYINEDYDEIHNDQDRLTAIVNEIKRIQILPADQQQQLIKTCQEIAEYNRAHFFSTEFFNQVVDELETNVAAAYNLTQGKLDLELWWNTIQWYKKNGMRDMLSRPYRKVFLPLYRQSRVLVANKNTSPITT
jgi:hypothetical protein